MAMFGTYLHSPFPLEVGSHLPLLRHVSVDSEHFRPVEWKENIEKSMESVELNK